MNQPSDQALQPIGWLNRLFYRLQLHGVGAFLKVTFRFKVHGPPVPASGPLIVVANHLSLLDPVVLQIAVRRRMHYLMTSDYFFKPLLNRYVRTMRCIPVMEEGINREALRTALKALAKGSAVGIFPQGGLKEADSFATDLRGIGLLAEKSRAQIVPVRLAGTEKAWPRGARFFHPARIEVRRGEPFLPASLERGQAVDRRTHLDRITTEVMQTIASL